MKPAIFALLICAVVRVFPVSAQTTDNFSTTYAQFKIAIAKKDFAAALPLSKLAYEQGREQYGAADANTANLAYNYANMLTANERYHDAIEQLLVVEEYYEELYPRPSRELTALYLEMVNLLNENWFEGRSEYDSRKDRWVMRVVADMDDVVAKHPDSAAAFYHQATMALGKTGAIPLTAGQIIHFMETAEQSALKSWSELDKRTLEIQYVLGLLYRSTGKRNRAIAKLEHVADTFDNRVTFSHPWALAAHARLVSLYEEIDQSDKATKHCIAIGEMTPWLDELEPTPLYRQDPEYPMSYARVGREGTVKLSFDIDEEGFVKNPQVLEINGGKGFAKVALAALEDWRYAPKFENGKATTAEDRLVQIEFHLAK